MCPVFLGSQLKDKIILFVVCMCLLLAAFLFVYECVYAGTGRISPENQPWHSCAFPPSSAPWCVSVEQ